MTARGGIILALGILALAGYLALDRVHHPLPGVAAPEDPEQSEVVAGPSQWPVGDGASAFALADYRIHGRVLGVKRYPFDACAKIAPVDLALGWGRMSDWAVYHLLSVSQHGRFYLYEWGADGPPIPKREVETHSSNNHIIPADAEIAKALRGVCADDVLWLEGSLVEVNGPQGLHWRSSLTREDTGGAACEVVRVTNLVIEPSDRHWIF